MSSTIIWTPSDDTTLLQLIQEGKRYAEIASQLNRKIGDIKYHIGNLAVTDFNNGIFKDAICSKYGLTEKQLQGAVERVKRQEERKNTVESENKKERRNKDKYNKEKRVRLIPQTTVDKQDLILQYLIEIKEILVKK